MGMRLGMSAALVCVLLAGCAPAADSQTAGGDPDLVPLLLDGAEAGGWLVTPDDGPSGGVSGDCTGAPFAWADTRVLATAAEFLDRPDESIALILERLDGTASDRLDQVRLALAPCTPPSMTELHGAMIHPVADDSFAYQSAGTDATGDFTFSDLLIACGSLLLEGMSQSYSGQLAQAEFEDLVEPVVDRLVATGECTR